MIDITLAKYEEFPANIQTRIWNRVADIAKKRGVKATSIMDFPTLFFITKGVYFPEKISDCNFVRYNKYYIEDVCADGTTIWFFVLKERTK